MSSFPLTLRCHNLITNILTNKLFFTGEMDAVKSGELINLEKLSRSHRQEIYAQILFDKNDVMTPTHVEEELKRRGMTFAFVGQDMAPMRMMPFVTINGRGQYCWNKRYKVTTHRFCVARYGCLVNRMNRVIGRRFLKPRRKQSWMEGENLRVSAVQV